MKKIVCNEGLLLEISIILIFLSSTVSAESIAHGKTLLLTPQAAITGRVTDATDKQGLPDVTISFKGTTNKTTTDTRGNFSIIAANSDSILIFSLHGYATQEITISSQTTFNIELVSDVNLSPLVATGYSSQLKKNITGAIAITENKELLSTPAANLAQALQGKVAGVTVGNDNSPGGGVMLRIRGFSNAIDSSPLYVMDGIAIVGDLNTLNPNDIESIQILKDASASSIYGSRAANGVVIITTKKGKIGRPVFTYDMYYGTQHPGKIPGMLSTEEYARLTWESRINAGAVGANGNPVHAQFGNGPTPIIPDYIFPAGAMEGDARVATDVNGKYMNYSSDIDGSDFNKTKWLITRANKKGTNWLNEIYDPAPIQNHQLGVSGASKIVRYAVSLNYFDQQGIMIHTNFKRYSARVNTEFTIKKRVRIGENFQLGYGERVAQPSGNNNESNPISFAYRALPIIPVYDVSGVNFGGTRGTDLDYSQNPVALLWRNKDNIQKNVHIFGNTYVEVDILKNLKAKSCLGLDYDVVDFHEYMPRDIESAEARGSSFLRTTNTTKRMITWYNTVQYSVLFGNHHRADFLTGTESIRADFETEEVENYQVDGTGVQSSSGNQSDWAVASEFSKINLTFSERYFFEGTIRRDRVSFLPSKTNLLVYPALSAGWVFSQEQFFNKSHSWLNRGKLRAGWGKVSHQTNVGLDASAFGKIDLSIDWYSRSSTKILPVLPPYPGGIPPGSQVIYASGFSIPGYFGFHTSPYIGTARNRGVDLMLNYNGTAKGGKIHYSIGGNFSAYRNVAQIPGGSSTQYFGVNDQRLQNFVVTQENYPISSFYGYTIDGIFQTDAEAAAAPVNNLGTNQNRAGRFKFKDVNKDGMIDTKDLAVIGSPHPDFTYGVTLNINYKNFAIDLFGFGVHGNDIFNYVKYWTDFPTFGGNRSDRMLYESWRPGKNAATLPQLTSSDQVSLLPSTYYLENGSYFRMKNIQLSYMILKAVLTKVGFINARIYLQAQNLFTLTKYTGMDPEINLRDYSSGYDREIGVDGGAYPSAKQYLVGMNLSF